MAGGKTMAGLTYALLNLAVLAALAVTLVAMRLRMPWRVAGWTLVIMLLLTLVFDNVIIDTGIVAYDLQLISGVLAWLAPIEDFAYTIAAVMIVALVWEKGLQHAKHS